MLTKNEIIDYSKRVLDNYFNSQYSATTNSNLTEIPDKYDDDRPNRLLFHKVNEEIVSLHQELYSTFGEKRTNITDTFPYKYFGLTIPDNLGYHNLIIGRTYYLTINNDTLSFSLTAGETQWQSLINKLNTLTEEFSEAITIATVDGGTNRITVAGASFDNSYLNKFIIKDSTGVNKYVHRIKSIINSTTLELESVTNLSNSDAAIIYLDQKYVFSYDSQDIKVETNLNNTDYTEPRIIIKENEYDDDLVIALGCDLTKDIYNADDTSDVWKYGAKLEPADPTINTPYNMFHKNIFTDNTGGLIKTPLQCKESNGQVATYLTLSERDTIVKLNTLLTYLISGYTYSAVTPINLAVQEVDLDGKIFYKTTASIAADLANFDDWVIVSDELDLKLLKVVETKSDTASDPDEYFFRFESIPTGYVPTSLLGTLAGFTEGECQDLTPTDDNLILLKEEIGNLILSLKNKYLYVKDAILRKENAFDTDNADYLVSIYQAYLTTDKWLNAEQLTIDVRYTFTTYLGPVLTAVQARDTLLNARLAYIKTTGGYGELGLASIVGDIGDDGSEETWVASQTGTLNDETGGGGGSTTTNSYLTVELLRKELISAQNEYAPLVADGNFNNVTQSIIDEYDASYSIFVNYLQQVLSNPFDFDSDDSQEFQDTFTDYIEKKKALTDAIAFKSKTLEESNKLETLNQEQAQALAAYNESANNYFLSDEIQQDLEEAYRDYNSLSDEIEISDINGLIISNLTTTFTSDYIGRIVYKQGTTNKGITDFSGMTLTLDSVTGLSIGDTIEIHYSPMGSSNVLADKLEDIISSGTITSEDRVLISTLTSNNNTASISLEAASQNAVNDIFRNLQVADEELLTNSILTPAIEVTDFNSSINVSIKTIGRDVQIFFNYANVTSLAHPDYFVYGYQIQGRAKTWNDGGTVYDGANWYPLLNNDYANYALNDGGLNTTDGVTKATTSLTPFLMHKYLPIAGTLLDPLNRTIYYRFRKIIKTSTNDSIVGYSAWTTANYEAVIYPDQTGISGDTWIKLNDHEHPPIDDLIVATSRNVYEIGYTTHFIDISFNKTPENSVDQVGTKGYYIYRSTSRSGTPGNYTYPDQIIIDTVLDDKPYMSDYPSYPDGREFVYTDETSVDGITYYYGVSAFDHNDNVSDVIWCESSITAYNNVTPDTLDVTDIEMNLADIGTKGFFRIHFEIPIAKRVSLKEISITRRIGVTNQTVTVYPFTQAIYEGLNGTNEKYYIDDSSYWDSYEQNSGYWWQEYSFFKTGVEGTCTNFILTPKSIYNDVVGATTTTVNADLSEAIVGYTYNITFTSTINVEAKRGVFELTFDGATSRRLKYYVISRKKYDEAAYYPVGIANAEDASVFYSDGLLQYVDKTDPEITGILYTVTAYNDYGKFATSGPNSTVGVTSFINYRPQPVVIHTKSVSWIDNRIEVQFDNSAEIDTATLEVEKYKIYYSDDGGTNKYPVSYNNKIITKDKDEILKNSGGTNTVIYYQDVNSMYLSSEADSILFYVKSVTGVGATSAYKDLTNPLTEIDIEVGYTSTVADSQPATLIVTIDRNKIDLTWVIPLMFDDSNVSYVLEEYNGISWSQIFTTGNNENNYFYSTPTTLFEPEDFTSYNWRVSAIVDGIVYSSKEATTVTNNFIGYELDPITISSISYTREYAEIVMPVYSGDNADDIKEYVILQDDIEIFRGSNNSISIKCLPFGVDIADMPVYTYKSYAVSKYGIGGQFNSTYSTYVGAITTTGYIDYTLNAIAISAISYTREYAEIAVPVYSGTNFADVKEYVILQDDVEVFRGSTINNSISIKCLPFGVDIADMPVYTYKSYAVSIYGDTYNGNPSTYVGAITTTGYIDYTLNAIAISAISYTREYAWLTMPDYIGTNFADVKEYVILQDDIEVFRGIPTNSVISIKCLPFGADLADVPAYTYKSYAVSIYGDTYNGNPSTYVGTITTTGYIDYTPTNSGLSAPYAYAENNAIYVELPTAYEFIDDYNYYLYQSKTYWNGTSIISNGTVSSVNINGKDIVVSTALNIEVRNRLYINSKFYKVESVSGTTITLETNVGISAAQSFYIFELVSTGREELVKLPVIESDESDWFKNWSYGYEVKTVYGKSRHSSITYPVVITNWSDNDSLGTNLLAYWNMDMFDTVLLDNTGNGYNGTVYSATMDTGIINGSGYFDGSSYVNFGDVLDITGAFTWCIWFKTTTTGTAQTLICKDSGGGSRGPWIQVLATTGALQFTISGDGTAFTTANDTSLDYGDNIWHFAVGVFIPSTSLSLYIDGKLRSYNTTSIPASQFNSSANLNIGRRPNNSLFLTGNLDEIRIYDRALSEAEINKLYSSGKELNSSQNLDKYVIIKSSKSNFGYRGSDILLSAYVYEESVDITNGIPASKFRWKRNSACSTCDTTWNTIYNGCKNAIADNIDYYSRNAIYSVEILD